MLRLGDLASIGDAVKGNNLVVYLGIAAIALGYLATVSAELQKILGPLGRWLAARQARRVRRTAQTDVRILDMQGQLEHVGPRLDAVERQLYEMRRRALDHEPWDWQALSDLRRTNPTYPEPPGLLPPPTATPSGGTS